MPKAVRFNEYGGADVLRVEEVPLPEPGEGQVLVRVKAAGINPGEAVIRSGVMRDRFPAAFPSGQGSDLAGVVAKPGPGVEGYAPGDEVIGWSDNRAGQAEFVLVEVGKLTAKPADLPWEVAGGLYVVGSTAWGAVRSVSLKPGETVAVSGAAGGVGSLAVQLAKRAGAEVIGIAGPANHDWLTSRGVKPVAYGDGLAERLREAAPRIDAFIDTFGSGYVRIAVEELGVDPQRVDTIAEDFPVVSRYGVKFEGNAAGSSAAVLAELADLLARGEIELPIAATYPLAEVGAAYTRLEKRHTRGKIVLVP